MLRTRVVLSYGGKSYMLAQATEEHLRGKLACDCTKSELIRAFCDPDFPGLTCGHQIAIVSLAQLETESEASWPIDSHKSIVAAERPEIRSAGAA